MGKLLTYKDKAGYDSAMKMYLMKGYDIASEGSTSVKLIDKEGDEILLVLGSNDSWGVPFVLGFFLSLIGVIIAGLALKDNESRWVASIVGMCVGIALFFLLGFFLVFRFVGSMSSHFPF